MNKILLIDGHSILNRAFYGVPDLTNKDGLHTNAIFGFLNIMLKAMDDEKPTHLVVAFDLHAPTFRHEMYKEYKGTRHPMPDELREQVPVMKKLLTSMNIPIMEKAGFEADDLLGTAAKKSQADGWDAIILSGDRDLLQISDEHIKIRIPKTKGGKTEVEEYYPTDVVEKYGVTPKQFIDVKALMGDSSDNIPGVPKVGEKTAISLIQEFGSIDGIYENIDSVSKPAIKTSLAENKEMAYFCQKLVTIITDAELPIKLSDAEIGDFYNENSFVTIKELELKSFFSKFDVSSMKPKHEAEVLCFDSFSAGKNEISNLFTDSDKVSLKIHFLTKEEKRMLETSGEQLSLFDNFSAQNTADAKPKALKAASVSGADKTIAFVIADGHEEDEFINLLKDFILKDGKILVAAGVKNYYPFLPEEQNMPAHMFP